MRNAFHKELDTLDKSLMEMVALCQQVIDTAVKVLLTNKDEKLKKVIKIRDTINKQAHITEDLCMRMLVRQQPLARDMNKIAYSLKLIRDMERIGTQAVELAIISKDIYPEDMRCSEIIHLMTEEISTMLQDTMISYMNKNPDLAQDVINRDDRLDKDYLKVKSNLSDQVFLNKNETSTAIDILMVTKYLERIGDHIVNIARWIIELE